MHKFPSDFDAGVFVGRNLEMICINANQVYFHFSDHAAICAENAFEHKNSNGCISIIEIPCIQSELTELLERKVTQAYTKRLFIPTEEAQPNYSKQEKFYNREVVRVHTIEADELTIEFENGMLLRFNPYPSYEAFRVCVLGKTIII